MSTNLLVTFTLSNLLQYVQYGLIIIQAFNIPMARISYSVYWRDFVSEIVILRHIIKYVAVQPCKGKEYRYSIIFTANWFIQPTQKCTKFQFNKDDILNNTQIPLQFQRLSWLHSYSGSVHFNHTFASSSTNNNLTTALVSFTWTWTQHSYIMQLMDPDELNYNATLWFAVPLNSK